MPTEKSMRAEGQHEPLLHAHLDTKAADDAAGSGSGGGFSWLTALGFAFLTFMSAMAIYRSRGDAGAVSFVAFWSSFGPWPAPPFLEASMLSSCTGKERRRPFRSRAMASPPLHSISFDSFAEAWIPPFAAAWLSAMRDGYDAAFMSARRRRKDPNQTVLQVAETCYTGTELDRQDAKDGKQESHHNLVEQFKQSHECILQMNRPCGLRSWAMPPPGTSFFILDSGATSHVVGDVSFFSPSLRSRAPTTPAGSAAAAAMYQAHDGRVLTVAGVGTVSWGNFHIPNVLCVPDLRTGLNLVSVQQLAECDYLVMFGGGQCSVMDRTSGKIVGKGRLHADDGLYQLEFLHIPHDDKACDCKDSTAASP